MPTLPYEVLFKDNGAARGLADIASKTDAAGAATAKLTAEQARLAAAERRVADAAGSVRIAEAKLEGVRNNGKATAAQRLTAEERLAASQRRLVGAQQQVASATTRVAAAHRQVGAQVQQTTKKVDESTSRLRVLGKVGGGSLKVVGVGAAAAVGGVALLGTGLFKLAGYGLNVASANEQAAISFTTMLGSAKKADAFLTKLKAFAAATPFEFPELQLASSSLISVGVNASKVIPIMRTLGDVTSGMGTGSEGVKRATIALQQMQSAGRITAEDLNQLRDAGIPLKNVMAAISAETGISTKKLFEMSRQGKLGKKELEGLMKALESGKGFERFNGLMDKQSKSLAGMLSTLKDVFGQGLADSLQGFFPYIKGAVASTTISVGKFFQHLQTHQEAAVLGLQAVGDAVLTLGISFLTMAQQGLVALSSVGRLWDSLSPIERMSLKKLGIDGSGFSAFGKAAGDAANVIGGELLPKLTSAQRKWADFGKDQAAKAHIRDTIMKATLAFDAFGHAANGSQIHLKHWADRAKLGAGASGRLEKQLKDAKGAFHAQISAMQANGAGHKAVAKATDQSRAALAREFRQMGLSKSEAEQLARKYLKVPKKVQTKVSAPGASATSSQIAALNAQYAHLPRHITTKIVRAISTRGTTRITADGGLITTKGVLRRGGGGPIPGYSPHARADNIPTMTTAGEYVEPVSAVRMYGAGAMDAIRTGAVPPSLLRAYGGGVGVRASGAGAGSSGDGGGGNTYILNAPNYVGSTNDLRRTLVEMARRNELSVLTRR